MTPAFSLLGPLVCVLALDAGLVAAQPAFNPYAPGIDYVRPDSGQRFIVGTRYVEPYTAEIRIIGTAISASGQAIVIAEVLQPGPGAIPGSIGAATVRAGGIVGFPRDQDARLWKAQR